MPARRPWLAALLSLLCVQGLGQLYNGQALKAVVVYLGMIPAFYALLWSTSWLPLRPLNVVLPLVGLALLPLAAAVEAWLAARRLRDTPRPWYSRWYALVPIVLLHAFVAAPAIAGFIRSGLFRAYSISAGSMEPGLLGGDRILVDRAAYGLRVPLLGTVVGRRTPKRGDIVVFIFPYDRRRDFVKRVVGLPGETVQIRSGAVSIDGKPLTETYTKYLAPPGDDRGDWGPQQVPAGQLFVLGDNRDNSRDSRFFGSIPIADVLGKPWIVYFSLDPGRSSEDTPHVRWGRIGMAVR